VTVLTISMYPHKQENRPKTEEVPWPDFFLNPVVIRRKEHKERLGLWQACVYREGDTRSNANVDYVTAFVQDFDYQGQTMAATADAWRDYECLIHTTASHTPEWQKFRVIVPLTRSMSRAEHTAMWRWVTAKAQTPSYEAICPINKDSRAVSQPMYLPCVVEGMKGAGSFYYEGPRFDPDVLGPYMQVSNASSTGPVTSRAPGTPATLMEKSSAQDALRKMTLRVSNLKDGERHEVLLRVAYAVGGMIAAGRLVESEAFDALHQAACVAGLASDEVQRLLNNQFSAGAEKPLWGELEDADAEVHEAADEVEKQRLKVAALVLETARVKYEVRYGGDAPQRFQALQGALTEARNRYRELQSAYRRKQTEARKALERAEKLAKVSKFREMSLSEAHPETLKSLQVVATTGLPKANLFNLVTIFENDPVYIEQFVYDTFSEKLTIQNFEAADHIDTNINFDIQSRYRFDAPTTLVREAVFAVARHHETHRIREYLTGLTWDGIERLPYLMSRGFRATSPDPDLMSAAGVKFCISAVARVLEPRASDGQGGPGCKVDTIIVLIGRQGSKKSSAFAALASPEWFSDTHMDLTNKDAYLQIQGVWIYEMSELDALRRADVNRVKAFISSQNDNFRPPYGKYTSKRPRQVVLVGTTNEDEFLTDPTGSRRFVPMRIPEGVEADLEWIREKRDQLWAEAVVRYYEGESWWYAGAEADRLAEHSELFNQEDPWESLVSAYMTGFRKAKKTQPLPTTTSLLINAVHMTSAQITKAHTNRMAALLRKLEYVTRQIDLPNGGKPRVWMHLDDPHDLYTAEKKPAPQGTQQTTQRPEAQ
jgi:predicted P-loop ATPase